MAQNTEFAREVVILTHEYQPFAGGIARYIEGLVDELARSRIPVSVIAPDYAETVDDARSSNVPVNRLLRHHSLTPALAIRTLMALRRCRRDAFFHAGDIRSAFVLYIARRLFGIRYGITIHGSEVSKFGGKGLKKRVFGAVYGGAHIIFANSYATRDIFEHNFGTGAQIKVTHLGVDEHWFRPAPHAFRTPALAAIDDGRPIVSTVARIDRRKGQLFTLQSLAHGLGNGTIKDVTYVIAGPTIDPDYESELRDTATTLGVPFIAAGRVSEEDLKRLYRISACHVLAAIPLDGKVEGFGLVTLEAGAQACPSVGTQTGGIPEVIKDGRTGLICKVDDVVGLSEAISRILADPAVRRAMSAAILQHSRRFSWNACMYKTYGGLINIDPA
jgi:phosphatidylinositol alpha-1,6-mannosyltransferase